jgi:hypothetical protein
MVEKRTEAADADRRRFLELAAKLGLAVPAVVTLTLTKPSYAAGSGFSDPPGGGSSSGSSSGGNSSGGSSSGSRRRFFVFSHEGRGGDGGHHQF